MKISITTNRDGINYLDIFFRTSFHGIGGNGEGYRMSKDPRERHTYI